MQYNHIALIGLGLISSSIALSLRRKNKNVKITDFTKHLACMFKGYIGSKHTRAYMCHELNYEKEPIKKLEELIFKEDLWKNGQDLYSKVI